jgi:predicted phosphodiesterase
LNIAIISDIHGNFEALRMVLADIDALGVKCICLGDCIGYGPEPEAVITEIRRREISTIIGNHEQALFDHRHLAWFNPLAQKSLEKTVTMLSAASIDYLKQLPSNIVTDHYLGVHGYPPDSVRTYLFQKTSDALIKTFKATNQPIFFVGHTHDLELISFDGLQIKRTPLINEKVILNPQYRYIVNVGSVGQPRDGNNNAKYALYDSSCYELEIRFIPYDIATTVAKIKAVGMPETHANRLW